MTRQKVAYAICAAWAVAKFFAWTIFAVAILTNELWSLAAQWRDVI